MTDNTAQHVPHRPLILIAAMLAMFMAAIEVTIVATAMPSIIAGLGGFSHFGWVFSIYLLTQAVCVPLYGRLADIWGRKKVFFLGTSLFLLGSVLCGFAPSMTWLIFFRAFQGLGAGAIMPLASTIVADVYGPDERARVQGWLSSVWGFAAITGPLTGAWIVLHFNWAVVFWVNLPVGVIAMLMLARWLAEPVEKQPHRLNITGSVLMMVTVTALIGALLQAQIAGVWLLLLLAVAAGGGWLLYKHERSAQEPLFPHALWRSRIQLAGNAGNLIIGAAMMGISAFLPTWIQGVNGGTPLEAGSALAMMSIGWPLASTLSGRVIARTSYRVAALMGSILLIAGCGSLLLLHSESRIVSAGLMAFLIGSGMGMTSTTFLVAVQNDASYHIRGICTASVMFSRMLGSALGTAVMGAVLNYNLALRLPDFHDPVQQMMSPAQRAGLSGAVLQRLTQQVAGSLHWVFFVALLFALACVVAAKMLPAADRPGSYGVGES
ncbi:MFS transporter [Erwinia sp. OLTSP20]|uniref:MDR family MFS transporter n=1 Tax=unclassified Erwinia TaxID=2622719 RepID=UPI000C180727|nr:MULTISPECIES: MDR family MFS transporter [unclassified Erwinia]PIJ51699.1 MFS transporter [Erwinia sp. OAMSP11]PIJ75586.1 MFS transporter [Erwinia sp. OLSSP12]PIJ84891.1 MFS transporter [Erwinia sp. OLCASP19]PIJ86670.1 MFS transporter [Erwinia sp. OLMTSP26]PIJ88111.1 MFS transporter [Erwinia sp. OLMDSP33]